MTQPAQRPTRQPKPRTLAPAPAQTAESVALEQRRRSKRRPLLLHGTERVTYEDDTGRRWAVLVPAGHAEAAPLGMVVGPPSLDALRLPESIAVKLHNELHDRGLLTEWDLRGRAVEIQAALQAALRIDAGLILDAYRASE